MRPSSYNHINYQVLDEIENGSYGVVYNCVSEDTSGSEIELVVKIILNQPTHVILNEIRILKKLENQARFPTIIDFGFE